jgi:hypothetical protein
MAISSTRPVDRSHLAKPQKPAKVG